MKRILASSPHSQEAYALVEHLQTYFVKHLDALSAKLGASKNFEPVEWFRCEGENGGGVRYVASDETLFNRASVNVSQVQYESDTTKGLASASAISTIIHPKNPYAPSMHMHISWTELKDGRGYWRMMADLNPSIVNETDTKRFSKALEVASGDFFEEGSAQGDRYFKIPALNRHRGVAHFYLENFNSGDFNSDMTLAKVLGEVVIETYTAIIDTAISTHIDIDKDALDKQLAYHSVYLFQVLTLDRGTTSGLLVHNQNDVGILGSIPSHVNRKLITSWIDNMTPPQDALLKGILKALPKEDICYVDDVVKQNLANAVRTHYQQHKEALSLQAQGNTIPTTVNNHK